LPEAAVVDTGPLVALADARDDHHDECVELLETTDSRLYIPALVVAEATYLISTRLGPESEARFLAGLTSHAVVAPEPEDWQRMADLVRQYADFPLGGTDASVVVLAERLKTNLIFTLDRRHFGAVRPWHCASFRLRPD
jgi:predicted nucleic acid-binding protein